MGNELVGWQAIVRATKRAMENEDNKGSAVNWKDEAARAWEGFFSVKKIWEKNPVGMSVS